MRQIEQGSRRLYRCTRRVYLESEIEQILHEKRMFAFVHSAQEEGWRLEGDAIATQTSPLSTQREQENITSPTERMRAISTARRENVKDLITGIRSEDH